MRDLAQEILKTVCEGCGENFHKSDDVYWPKSGEDAPVCDGCAHDGGRMFEYDPFGTEGMK